MYVLFCIFCFHRANWHSSVTLTEVLLGFFSVVRQMPGYNILTSQHFPLVKKNEIKNIEIFQFTLQMHITGMLSVVMEDWKTVNDSSEKYFPSLNIEKCDCLKYPFTSVISVLLTLR
jgi:uncharacterized membrane protein